MRNGKISENVLIRSVLRRIKTKREEVICGAGIGKDCAVLAFGEGEEVLLSTNPVTAPADDASMYGIHRVLNNLAASGAEPVGLMIAAMLPEGMEETKLQEMMEQTQELCSRFHVQLIGGHTEVTAAVKMPLLTITGVGKRKKGVFAQDIPPDGRRSRPEQGAVIDRQVRPGQDVVISKWIGLEGTVRLAKEHKEELCSRYPVAMIEEAASFERFLSSVPEAATAVKSGVSGIHDVSQGGIFGALWELAQGAGVGLEIDLKKIPVKQETIEICEFFDLNPYELLSGGSLLMTTDDGCGLTAALERENIASVIIGKTTAGNDRVLVNEEERRFLEPPKTDQFYPFICNS